MVTNLFWIIACHLLGDYVLQTDYLAKGKESSWYCLFVHCFLYCIPFAIIFGIGRRLIFIFIAHIVVDAFKARFRKINLALDQTLHYLCAALMYL